MHPRRDASFMLQKKSVVLFRNARCVRGVRHMSCTAGGTLGGLSPPYAQHAPCPIQMRQLQK